MGYRNNRRLETSPTRPSFITVTSGMISTGIRRHGHRRLMVAKRTGDGGLELHGHHRTSLNMIGST
jgi:hypothetical protein